jgi:heme-degrading monooxygenase HmoA
MIIRLWTAHATPEGAAKSQARFVEKILPTLKPLGGFLGASFLRRLVGDEVELVLLTRWQSLEAVRAFAGDDIERAVVADDAATMLKRWDDRVRHYEVALEHGASAPSKRRRVPSKTRPRASKKKTARRGGRGR